MTTNQRRIKELEMERSEIVKRQLVSKLHAISIINQSEIKKQELQIEQLERELKILDLD